MFFSFFRRFCFVLRLASHHKSISLSMLVCCSGEWFCSFCRDLTAPEMVYDTGDSQKTVKEEPDSEGLTPVDKRVRMIYLS